LVEQYLQDAKGIAFDTCHKIYVLMDEEQVALMREYEYDEIVTASEKSPSEMLGIIKGWFDASCGLRFVDAVETNKENPNDGFTVLIGQFDGDECEDCGESGCSGVCNDDDELDEDEDE
jgi:hypothetical protein